MRRMRSEDRDEGDSRKNERRAAHVEPAQLLTPRAGARSETKSLLGVLRTLGGGRRRAGTSFSVSIPVLAIANVKTCSQKAGSKQPAGPDGAASWSKRVLATQR